MIEAIAFATVCFIICKDCTFCDRLKKGAGGAILFVALFQSYNILQPLLPTEIDHLLHSTVWGVLFAYAVPNSTKGTDKAEKDHNEDQKVDGEEQEAPNSTLN